MTMTIWKNKGLNLLLIAGSILASLLLCEGLVRIIYTPADIHPAHPAVDDVLGHRINPHESGHDSRGFRNADDTGDFQVVCIGDSFTYGDGVPRKSAFPQQLGRTIRQKVYNMAMGGYGPVQYYYLISQAMELHPRKIIITFYLGNDLLDAYYMVERHDYWKWLASGLGPENQLASISPCDLPCKPAVEVDLFYAPEIITLRLKESGSFLFRLHSFLRLNSAFYSLQYAGITKPLIQKFFEREQHLQHPGAFACKEVDTIFTPGTNLRRVDLADHRVRQGALITRRIIHLMVEGRYPMKDLLLAFMPTKEAVYYHCLKSKGISLPNEYTCSIYYERELTKWLTGVTTAAGLQAVDLFPLLDNAVLQGQKLYHSSSDGHLNKVGNSLVAAHLAQVLEKSR
jgi:lysophospholipase L1-like esterase